MLVQIVEMVAWAGLALGATRLSWHRSEAVIGLALLLCSLLTSAAYFGSSLSSRLALEVGQAVCVAATARIAFLAVPSGWSLLIALLALVDCALAGSLSFAFAVEGLTAKATAAYLGWGANLVFALQCALVGFPGVLDVALRRLPARRPGGCLDPSPRSSHVGQGSGRGGDR